jgi:hypothetical protein
MKWIKETPTRDRKPMKGKEQDHLKKASLGPVRHGQRLDTSETKPCSSKEHKQPKHIRAPPARTQTPPEQVPIWSQTGQAGSQNRSDHFGTADYTPEKPKMQKKCTSSPLTLGIGSMDAMQLFSTFLSPLVANAWIKAQIWKYAT